MSDELKLTAAISLPTHFKIAEVVPRPHVGAAPANAAAPAAIAPPDLGPLSAFVGNWHGNGFNTIFRPNSPVTPTPLPNGPAQGDNVLELNLTSENLSFSASLGSVPNRGMVQADAFLNGVPYLQAISDVTIPNQPVGIHLEPGLWVIVPATTNPAEGVTLVRMASIPHGTTINAQGTSSVIAGPPTIPAVDITPFTIQGHDKIPFPSQTASNQNTPRIPQDLSSFIAAGTITQAMLSDPNTVLRDHIKNQKITSTVEIKVSTSAPAPLVGGGTDNIAFLLGTAAPNAAAVQMDATFWIETVEHTITLPPHRPGLPIMVKPDDARSQHVAPTFMLTPPPGIPAPHTITIKSKQIQYTQTVLLNFNGLSWPHVSVATLVPAGPVVVPWP